MKIESYVIIIIIIIIIKKKKVIVTNTEVVAQHLKTLRPMLAGPYINEKWHLDIWQPN